MLVLAPAACIVGGIALSTAFDTLTRSVKYAPAALPALLTPSEKVRAFTCIYYIDSFELFVPGSKFSTKVGIIFRVRCRFIVRDVRTQVCQDVWFYIMLGLGHIIEISGMHRTRRQMPHLDPQHR